MGEEAKERQRNRKRIHTAVVEEHLNGIPEHPLLQRKAPAVHRSEEGLPRAMRCTMAQLRAWKCPLLQEYLHGVGADEGPSCPLWWGRLHDTLHLYTCPSIQTGLTPVDLWRRPTQAADLVER